MINTLEKKRKKLLKKLFIAIGSFSFVFIFGFVMLIKTSDIVVMPLILLVLIYLVVIYSMKFKVVNSFVAEYNKVIFGEISTKFQNIGYKREPKNGYFTHKLKPNLGKLYLNDEFNGVYNGVNFSFCDARMELGVSDFKGKIFVANFNKSFASEILITNLGILKNDDLTKFSTDNSYINENFTLLSKNLQEAMYILTPSLLEKIEQICIDKDGKSLKADILFSEGKLYMALDSKKDALEPNLFKTIDILNSDDFKAEIEKFFKFIEYLKLDNTLFKAR